MPALVVVAAASLGACGEDPQPPSLPPLTETPTPSSASPSGRPSGTSTQGLSDKQQVEILYLDFLANYRKAQDRPKKARRAYLSRWMIDPALTQITGSINGQEQAHQRSAGKYESNIISIRLKGSDATVDDCVDQSGFVIKDTKTGEVVSDDSSDYFWAVATMKKTKKGWRIDQTGSEKEACTGRS